MATWVNLLDIIYPVGSIYQSTNSTSPASVVGGTWSAIGGRFLLGANSTYTAGSQDGAATVTLTVDQMPSHQHTFSGSTSPYTGGTANSICFGPNPPTHPDYIGGDIIDYTGGASTYKHAALLRSLYLAKNSIAMFLGAM